MRVPADPVAEAGVVGSLVLSSAHAPALAAMVAPEDFRDRRYGRMFAGMVGFTEPDAGACPLDPDEWAAWMFPRRAAAVAVLAEGREPDAGDAAEVERCVAAGSYDAATVAALAERVTDAARRRRAMVVLSEAYNALGEGVDLGDVRPMLAAMA